MLTKELIDLIAWADSFVSNGDSIADIIQRTSEFLNYLTLALSNVRTALSYLYFFIPKSYFDPLITIFLLIMLAKCVMALVNLLYP